MADLKHWRLPRRLTVFEAAMLHDGIDPSTDYHGNLLPDSHPVATALQRDIEAGVLEADIKHHIPIDCCDEPAINWHKTTISIDGIRDWLRSRGVTTGFFFDEDVPTGPDYLNPNHPNYSPHLAATIQAWQAVTAAPELTKGKHPRQALAKWLTDNAARFGLSNEAIKRSASIANWRPEGGAPKTPASNSPTHRHNLPTH